ncbi:SDR family oxidoreductase [Salisediminibacterium selenitireducens]|uniref:NAD-dependent epimerase/dehydratase n=1 Tax=Bacillus selenitireducens (strain ATCC 700615 / DSM 15326 / MLS10) TaxID=439292 RepID=D6Y0X0_BACIE|nr:SDR family oxidoreductase [Salisediminibacterium selenitireducens]ADH98574.1 NAD-dependent epimerase/dehydratase [[Bacillus] selenitireducens MLS10]
MNVLVVGANGQIGTHLVKQLKAHDGHSVKAMVRKKEQAEAWEQEGVHAVVADLESDVGDLKEVMEGSDAVVFTAGSGGATGADKTLLIDLDGAVKTMEAAEAAGIERYVMVSAIQAHNRANWNEQIRHYFAAKHYADRMLELSSLNYTIVRPGGLLNDPGKGTVSAATDLERGSIPREDVAATIVAALDHPNAYRKGFDLVSGNDAPKAALDGLT